MKPFRAFICWLLIATQAFAVTEARLGTTGLTVYFQYQTGPTTFKGIAATESPASSGIYQLTDTNAVSGGLTSTDGDYPFWAYSGAPSDTPSATKPLAEGTLGWTGTVERPRRTNATYWLGTALATPRVAGFPEVLPPSVTWYVAASGGNDSNSGNVRSSPFATAAHAHSVAVAGDTIHLNAGSYADDGTNPFITITKDRITIEGDSEVLTVINDTAFDSGIWLSGKGCVARNLKVVGTNAGDIGITAGDNALVEYVTLSTKELGLNAIGNNVTAHHVTATNCGRYGIEMKGDNFILYQSTGSTNATFTFTANSDFAGIYVAATRGGKVVNCTASAAAASTSSTGRLLAVRGSDTYTTYDDVRASAINLSATLTGGTYAFGNTSGQPVVGELVSCSLSAAGSSGTVKEIDASASGSYLNVVGTNTTPANWVGTSNIHTPLEPATPGRTLVVDANGLGDATAVKLGPSGSATAQTARDAGAALDVATSTRASATAATNILNKFTAGFDTFFSANTSNTTVDSQTAAIAAGGGGGSGTPAQVNNNEPIDAFTAKLGTRSDGVMKAFPVKHISPRQKVQLWVDCSKLTNVNLADVTNGVSSNSAKVSVTSTGMYGKYATWVVDASSASDGDTTTLTADVTPNGSQLMPISLDVVVDAN